MIGLEDIGPRCALNQRRPRGIQNDAATDLTDTAQHRLENLKSAAPGKRTRNDQEVIRIQVASQKISHLLPGIRIQGATGLVVYRGGVINHGDRASRLEGNLNPLWRHQRSHFLHQRGDHTAGCTPQETCCMAGDSELIQDARDI